MKSLLLTLALLTPLFAESFPVTLTVDTAKPIDQIFSAYLKNGVRPLVQLGFMPEALSTNPQPYRHHWTPTAKYGEIFTGWAYPVNDYTKWGELCYQLAKHCVEKYGRAEVETWWWQPWNEYNGGYWTTPFFPASGPANGCFNGLHPKSNSLAVKPE